VPLTLWRALEQKLTMNWRGTGSQVPARVRIFQMDKFAGKLPVGSFSKPGKLAIAVGFNT
jgi:hypothetical protein